jgi:hypothetical protein
MAVAAAALTGRPLDFTTFSNVMKATCADRDPVCTLDAVTVTVVGGGDGADVAVVIDVRGSRFLYNMVTFKGAAHAHEAAPTGSCTAAARTGDRRVCAFAPHSVNKKIHGPLAALRASAPSCFFPHVCMLP